MKENRKNQTHQQISTSPVCPDCMYPIEPEWDECPFCAARNAIPRSARTWALIIDAIDELASPLESFLGERTARLFAAITVGSAILTAILPLLAFIFYIVNFVR